MKWISSTLSTLAVSGIALSSAGVAHAKELCPETGPFTNLCNLKIGEDASKIIGTIVVVLLIIAIITSLFFIIFGATRYVTSAGDQAKAQQARSTIIAAVVGLVIALSTFFIVNLVAVMFTGQGIGGFSMPKLI